MCGEHFVQPSIEFLGTGSSPRVRGTRRPVCGSALRSGIIPACAGNTAVPANDTRAAWDHPRVCGEHGAVGDPWGEPAGSSPRVRGTHRRLFGGFLFFGIIPACAGNTTAPNPIMSAYEDHPRVCGEHMFPFLSVCTPTGSSPRVRGTLQWRAPAWRECGIIPACAGNTLLAISSMQSFRDHPRVCGEHGRYT